MIDPFLTICIGTVESVEDGVEVEVWVGVGVGTRTVVVETAIKPLRDILMKIEI